MSDDAVSNTQGSDNSCSFCDKPAFMELVMLDENNQQIGVFGARCEDHLPDLGADTHVVVEKVPNYGRCCELPDPEQYPMGTVVRCEHGKRWITDVEGMVFGGAYWRRKLLPW